MLAAVLRDFDRMEIEEVPTPSAAVGEVLVRIVACGICQTDYKAYRGIRRNVTFPTILGHEAAGTVESVGAGVTHVREGDAVIIMPSAFCGRCRWCREGLTHYCVAGYVAGGDGARDVRSGAFAEYEVIDGGSVFPKPPELSFDAAALTEPLAGAWKGTIGYSRLSVGEDVVVIGVGSIGLLVAMVARAAGAGTVIAVDISDYALENARRLAGAHTVNADKEDVRAAVYDMLPDGPDLIIEAAGPIEAVQSMLSLRRRGTRLNLFGITTPEQARFDAGEAHFLETRMDASFGVTPMAMQQAIRLMERGLVDPALTITHRFPLTQIGEAMAAMARADRNKVMVDVGGAA